MNFDCSFIILSYIHFAVLWIIFLLSSYIAVKRLNLFLYTLNTSTKPSMVHQGCVLFYFIVFFLVVALSFLLFFSLFALQSLTLW